MRKSFVAPLAFACALMPTLADAAKLGFGGSGAGPTPPVVRTFTTTLGTHYFNGTQLVTCTTTGACSVQPFTAKDIVPFGQTGGRLLVLLDSTSMQTCNVSLNDCVPMDKEHFPGAKPLLADGTWKLQGQPYSCGYTPTAGYNCGGFRHQPAGNLADKAMALVGQQGVTHEMSITTTCSAGMSGCDISKFTRKAAPNSQLKRVFTMARRETSQTTRKLWRVRLRHERSVDR